MANYKINKNKLNIDRLDKVNKSKIHMIFHTPTNNHNNNKNDNKKDNNNNNKNDNNNNNKNDDYNKFNKNIRNRNLSMDFLDNPEIKAT
jgi:hypothetical protein